MERVSLFAPFQRDLPHGIWRVVFWVALAASVNAVGCAELLRHEQGHLPLASAAFFSQVDAKGFLGAFYFVAVGPFWTLFAMALFSPWHREDWSIERNNLLFALLLVFTASEFSWKLHTESNCLAGVAGAILGLPVGIWLLTRFTNEDVWIGRFLIPLSVWPLLCLVFAYAAPPENVFMRFLNTWLEGSFYSHYWWRFL